MKKMMGKLKEEMMASKMEKKNEWKNESRKYEWRDGKSILKNQEINIFEKSTRLDRNRVELVYIYLTRLCVKSDKGICRWGCMEAFWFVRESLSEKIFCMNYF